MRETTPANTRPLAWVIVLAAALLSACAGDDDDLSQWMAQQRAQAKPRVQPVRPPASYQPQAYLGVGSVSPFADEKLTRVLRSDSGRASQLLAAEQRRRREPLEDFPLDAMSMAGILDKAGRRVALVRVNGLLYQVSVGNYLGQNYGRVTAISENQITLREIVQDAAGEWVERTATLQLLEGTGK